MIEIYTDGATSNNGYEGARGGWAYIIINENNIIETNKGNIPNATNNICELTAILKGCEAVKETKDNVIIYSDSAYCINCYKQHWYRKWQINGWQTSQHKPVANKELWQKLIVYFEDERFTFDKVRGHADNFYNNLVDKLAVEAKFNG